MKASVSQTCSSVANQQLISTNRDSASGSGMKSTERVGGTDIAVLVGLSALEQIVVVCTLTSSCSEC